jgi:hypothetical protein
VATAGGGAVVKDDDLRDLIEALADDDGENGWAHTQDLLWRAGAALEAQHGELARLRHVAAIERGDSRAAPPDGWVRGRARTGSSAWWRLVDDFDWCVWQHAPGEWRVWSGALTRLDHPQLTRATALEAMEAVDAHLALTASPS